MESKDELRQKLKDGFDANLRMVRFTIEKARTALPSNLVIWQFSLNCKAVREEYEEEFCISILEEMDAFDREFLLADLDELNQRIVSSNSFDKEGEFQTFREVYKNITGEEYASGDWADREN